MQITVTIPDEIATKVQARSLTPESYVESLIDNAVHASLKPLPPAKLKMDMESFFQELAAYSDKIPQIPHEAFTRESFYQDHD
ncbi:MAG: hypothetical protein WAN35_20115 [Terracidiphilus sp.]